MNTFCEVRKCFDALPYHSTQLSRVRESRGSVVSLLRFAPVPHRFKKSTPSPNCQLIVYYYELKPQVDGCMGKLTFYSLLIDSLCEMIPQHTTDSRP